MNKETLEEFRGALHQMIADLEAEVASTVSGMRGDATPFPDPNDRASLESERNLLLRIRDRERKLRNKVEEALERIEAGTFGICEVCEEEISYERLRARPVTTLCINCKSEQEVDETKHGI